MHEYNTKFIHFEASISFIIIIIHASNVFSIHNNPYKKYTNLEMKLLHTIFIIIKLFVEY